MTYIGHMARPERISLCWHQHSNIWIIHIRGDSKFAPSQWETALLCNDVSHGLGASLELFLPHSLVKLVDYLQLRGIAGRNRYQINVMVWLRLSSIIHIQLQFLCFNIIWYLLCHCIKLSAPNMTYRIFNAMLNNLDINWLDTIDIGKIMSVITLTS